VLPHDELAVRTRADPREESPLLQRAQVDRKGHCAAKAREHNNDIESSDHWTPIADAQDGRISAESRYPRAG